MNEHERTDLERSDDAPDTDVADDEASPYERTDLDWGARTDSAMRVRWQHEGGFNTDRENFYHYDLADSFIVIPGVTIQDPRTGFWYLPHTANIRGDGTWDLVGLTIATKSDPERTAETAPVLRREVFWQITDQARPAVRLESRDDLDINAIGVWNIEPPAGESEEDWGHKPWDTNWMTDEWGEEQGRPYAIEAALLEGNRRTDTAVEVRDEDRDGVWDTIYRRAIHSSQNVMNWDIAHLGLEVEELAYRPSAQDTDAYIINVLRDLVPSDSGVEWSDEDGLRAVAQDFLEIVQQVGVGMIRGYFDDVWPTSLAEPEPVGPQTFAFDYYIPGPASNFALYYLGKVFDQAAAATDTDGRFALHYGNFFDSSPHFRDLAMLMFGSPVYEESLDNPRLPPLVPARHRVDLQGIEPAVDSKGTRIVVQKEVNNRLVEVAQTLDFTHDSVDEVEQKLALITDALADPALGAPIERVTRVYGDQHTKGDGVTIVLNIFGVSEMPSVLPDALAYIGEGAEWGW